MVSLSIVIPVSMKTSNATDTTITNNGTFSTTNYGLRNATGGDILID